MTALAKLERVRRSYERTAHRYDECVGYVEKLLVGNGRRWVCSQARGDVLEIGIGTGLNLPHYPANVRLVGVDLTPAMLDVARAGALRDVEAPVCPGSGPREPRWLASDP